MRTLSLAFVLSLLCAVALAGPVTIQNPTIQDLVPAATCGAGVPMQSIVTGFSANGNYLMSTAKGWVACGHSGRGTNFVYYRWCFYLTFDLAGNLVSVTGQQSNAAYSACPNADAGATYTNSAGYTGYTEVFSQPAYGTYQRYPALDAP